MWNISNKASFQPLTSSLNPKMKSQVFVLNLPSEIILDILSRLSITTIATCKSVCKKWLKLISTTEFAKSHLLKSTPGLIVYLSQRDESQCTIYEFEDVLGLQRHDLHYKPVMKFDPNILRSSHEANIMIECSFNGLLCLRDDGNSSNTLLLCNPITREYLPLPTLPYNSRNYKTVDTYGIGMSLLSGKYKVVWVFHELMNGFETNSRLHGFECMVYTLGTGLWRSVESNEVYEYSAGHPNGAFMNGNLHWLVEDASGSQAISCFDLEMELFKPFVSPPFATFTLMTVVGECLCGTEYGSSEEIVIWMMKEYGVEESWTKVFVFDLFPEFDGMSYENGMAYETVIALKVFKDDVLMLQENSCLFYYGKETRTYREIDVFGRDKYGWIDALIYTPSFLSLRSFGVENVSSF